MLHCTHTHGGPYVYPYRGMGEPDEAYNWILLSANWRARRGRRHGNLQPAHLTYGEASTQIGVNRRETKPDGSVAIGHNYGGVVAPLVQVLVRERRGRAYVSPFCSAMRVTRTTMGRDNCLLTADWPGAAVALLRNGFAPNLRKRALLPMPCRFSCKAAARDINPLRRGTWAAVRHNGHIIADAAHTARWNAHGRMDDTLDFAEVTIQLPLSPPPSWAECQQVLDHNSTVMQQTLPADPEDLRGVQAQGRLEWAQAAQLIHCQPDFDFLQPFTI